MMQCEHIHGDGARCLSPAMHRRLFCYMHWRLREHKLSIPEPEFPLPTIDSEASVVLASSQIARAVLSGQLDSKRARVVLACLKMAVDSLRRQQDVTEISEVELTPSMHEELVGTTGVTAPRSLAASQASGLDSCDASDLSPQGACVANDASDLSSRAARSAARDLLLNRAHAAFDSLPADEAELERFIDQHPRMNLKPPSLADIMEPV